MYTKKILLQAILFLQFYFYNFTAILFGWFTELDHVFHTGIICTVSKYAPSVCRASHIQWWLSGFNFFCFSDFKFSQNPSDGILCVLNYNGKEFKGSGKNKKIAKATCCVKLLQDNVWKCRFIQDRHSKRNGQGLNRLSMNISDRSNLVFRPSITGSFWKYVFVLKWHLVLDQN